MAQETQPETQGHPPPQLTGPTGDQTLLTGPTPNQHKLPAPPPAEQKPKDKGRGRLWRIVLILAVIFGLLLLAGLLPRLLRRPQLNRDAKAQKNTQPPVNTVAAQAPPPFDELDLPGSMEAVQQTAVVARASGYLRRWLVDIGDKVKAGQVLAIIETPDLDQQVAQARAQLVGSQAAYSQAQSNVSNLQANVAQAEANVSRAQAMEQQAQTDLARSRAALAQAQDASAQQRAQLAQAQANLNLARVTARRYQNLLADGAIDQQTTDQAVAAYQTNQANVDSLAAALRAGQANVQAFRAAVLSSQSNVTAYAEGVRSSRAAVDAAAANVRSGRANVAAAAANINSNRANVARYASLQSFQNVTAPFAGVITARNVDTGAFISTSGGAAGGSGDSSSVGSGAAGTTALGNAAGGSAVSGGSSPGGSGSGGSGQTPSLFSIAQINTLRLYINVPQTDAGMVRVGQTAQVGVRELPGKTFLGTITRTPGALDAASRTLVAEIDLNNQQGTLRPGMFAQVRLRVPHPSGDVLVPDPALVTNAGGTQVILVGQNRKLHFQPVAVGRDFGQTIEITEGLKAGQQIVANPSDSLHEGETVQIAPLEKSKPTQ